MVIGGGVTIELMRRRRNRYAKLNRMSGSYRTTRKARKRCELCGGTGRCIWGGDMNRRKVLLCHWCHGSGELIDWCHPNVPIPGLTIDNP